MRRVGVVWIALLACDRGTPTHREPPANATTPVVRDAETVAIDGDPSAGAARVDAALETIDAPAFDAGSAIVPAKNQAGECAAAAVRISKYLHDSTSEEVRKNRAAITKACVAGPWPATVIDCALHTKANAYDCTDQLPAAQQTAFRAATKAVFCEFNDCIPDGVVPTHPPTPGSDGLDLDQ